MKSLQRQNGIAILSLAILAFLIIFFGLLTVKLSGSYFDHFTLNKMIESTINAQTDDRFVQSDFESRLKKNMEINNINVNLKNSLKIDKTQSPVVLVLDYVEQVHLFANVDVLMSFHEEYELQP